MLNHLKEHNEPVPKPLRLPTEEEVVRAENDLAFKFPFQYRKFMLEASNTTFGIREPGLILPDLMPYLSLRHIAESGWSMGIPKNHLPFCQDNGNYFTLSSEGEQGYYDHDDDTHTVYDAEFKDWIIEDWLDINENS